MVGRAIGNEIVQHGDSGSTLTQPSAQFGAAVQCGILGIQAFSLDIQVARNGHGAFCVALLAHDDEWLRSKDLIGACYGIIGADAGEVAHDSICRYTELNERVLHVPRLIVIHGPVITGDDDATHLATMPQVRGCLHARGVEVVTAPTSHILGAAQHQPHSIALAGCRFIMAAPVRKNGGPAFCQAYAEQNQHKQN